MHWNNAESCSPSKIGIDDQEETDLANQTTVDINQQWECCEEPFLIIFAFSGLLNLISYCWALQPQARGRRFLGRVCFEHQNGSLALLLLLSCSCCSFVVLFLTVLFCEAIPPFPPEYPGAAGYGNYGSNNFKPSNSEISCMLLFWAGIPSHFSGPQCLDTQPLDHWGLKKRCKRCGSCERRPPKLGQLQLSPPESCGDWARFSHRLILGMNMHDQLPAEGVKTRGFEGHHPHCGTNPKIWLCLKTMENHPTNWNSLWLALLYVTGAVNGPAGFAFFCCRIARQSVS